MHSLNKIEYSENNKVKEAGAAYTGSKSIRVYTSFSESEQDRFQRWAKLSPEERLSEFFSIMNRFYVFDKPVWKGKKIHVDQ